MLQHDRHFVRIELAHPRRKPHAPRMGANTDGKVMVSRNPITRHSGKDFPHGPAQGVLHNKIVADQVNGHSTRSHNAILDKIPNAEYHTRNSISESGGFCCQVPPDPALKCYLQGLSFGIIPAYRVKSNRSIVVISNYKFRPDDGGTMPGKRPSFTLPVEPISPPPKPAAAAPWIAPSAAGLGGGAGDRPR